MSETLYLFPLLKRKLGQFSFRILTIGYMIVLLRGVHLLITPALDLGVTVQQNISSKQIVVVSLICECSFDSESLKHFFLYCPRYAAQLNVLLTSAAKILGET